MKNLLGHIKGPVEAGDHEPVGVRVQLLYNFLP